MTAIPLVRSAALQGYAEQIYRYQQNPLQLLAMVNLPPSALRDPDIWLAYSDVAQLLTLSAAACDDEYFGFVLGLKQGIGVLGPLGILLMQQPDVAAAIALAKKYLHLHASGIHLHMRTEGDQQLIEFHFNLIAATDTQQLNQLSLGLLYRIARSLCGPQQNNAVNILVPQAETPRARAIADELNCCIRFQQPTHAVALPKTLLPLPPHSDIQVLQHYTQQNAIKLEQRFPLQLLEQVKHNIKQLLPLGECSIANVAMTQGISERVLQKRLQTQGAQFRDLCRQCRQEMARDLLLHSQRSLTDIALHLGYSELAVFSRNFRAWFGTSPGAWRRHNCSPPS